MLFMIWQRRDMRNEGMLCVMRREASLSYESWIFLDSMNSTTGVLFIDMLAIYRVR